MRNLVATALATTLGFAGVAAAQTPAETVIHRNVKGNYGEGVAVSRTGVVYGYAQYAFPGGDNKGNGVIYRLVKPKEAGHRDQWYYGYILVFPGGVGGFGPVGKPVFDGHDNMYGVTAWGGEDSQGLVFGLTETTPGSGTWNSAVLHHFGPSDGGGAQSQGASLILGANGVFYGTTVTNGTGTGTCLGSCGTVFSLTPPIAGQSAWTYQLLYAFQGGSDGDYPAAPLVQDAAGVLYGSTQFGGTDTTSCHDHRGCGTIFRLAPPGANQTTWTKTILYAFSAGNGNFGGPDGGEPTGSLTLDASSGALYGAAKWGGASEYGTIFVATPPSSQQSPWQYSVIQNFSCYWDPYGGIPNGGLIFGADHSLIGTTSTCAGNGTAFTLLPPSSPGANWKIDIMYTFPAYPGDASGPSGGFVKDALGNLIGTTRGGGNLRTDGGWGTTFEITP